MKVTEYLSGSKEETEKIAEDLAKTFQGGEVIFAYGPLGAGKTATRKSYRCQRHHQLSDL